MCVVALPLGDAFDGAFGLLHDQLVLCLPCEWLGGDSPAAAKHKTKDYDDGQLFHLSMVIE
jgi:hypothetical protein